MLASSINLEDCLKDPIADTPRLKSILVDETSPFSQDGKLKQEARHYCAFFRSIKSYLLSSPVDKDEEIRRLRSIRRRCQQLLTEEHFGQCVEKNTVVVRSTCLRASAGMDMTIMEESRALSHSLQLRRIATVNVSFVSKLEGMANLFSPLFSGLRQHGISAMTSESILKAEYQRLAKKGILPSTPQLELFCKKKGLSCSRKYIESLRYRFAFTAKHSKFKNTKKHFAPSFLTPGIIFVDMMHFRPDLKKFNDNNRAVLVGVDLLSGFMAAEPCPNFTTESWRKGVISFAQGKYNVCKRIVSDRDSAIKSGKEGKFRSFLWNKYRIKWSFNPYRSKAFASENGVGYLKRHLSQGLDGSKTKRWVGSMLEGIVRQHNAEPVPGTTFPRNSVTERNYLRVLEQKDRNKVPSMTFNISEGLESESTELDRFIWLYKKGQRVYLARRVDILLRDYQTFEKPSVVGAFGPNIYTISRCTVKNSKDNTIIPCYELAEFPGGKFYEWEIKPALFASNAVPEEGSLRSRRARKRRRAES